MNIIPFLKKWKLLNLILGALDILAIFVAFECAYLIVYSGADRGYFFFLDQRFLLLFAGITPLWLLAMYLLKATEIPRTKQYTAIFWEYFLSAGAIFMLLILLYFIFKLYTVSRTFIILIPVFGFLFLFTLRMMEYTVFKRYRSKGFNYLNVVLIADTSSLPFIESMLEHKEWGYKIVALFTSSEAIRKKYEETIIILPEDFIEVLNDLMEVDMIDEVLYTKSKVLPSEIRKIVRSCEELGVVFSVMYRDEKLTLSNAVKREIANYKFLTFINVPHNTYALGVKKIMDIFGSLLGIIVLSPLMIMMAILIKLSSAGPVVYKQPRVGLRGRQFELFKFRTMVANADEMRKELEELNEADGPAFKIADDPRVTKIGKFLRKTGLDELPQLFNVLKGEMSLIGPRPPLPEETTQYERWQLRRLSVKPGLSCFWQVKPDRNSIKFEKWMELDLAYIDNWSLRLDFVILLKTVKTIFHKTGL
ncbi:MAG: exopolysaccharide biosynthesis polyprenyl glycosylphosphotransferase [Bacteroidales bacterium]|nr:exopolysaccharide biosynthesis polyprenyl glycosylphosphotransferase [Bacteroidales bacterium]